MAIQEQPYPCVHLVPDRPQLHHRVSASSPPRPVKALCHPAACLEPALTEQDLESAYTTHTVAAPKIEDSSCDTHLDAVGTSWGMDMGTRLGAVWLLECFYPASAAHGPPRPPRATTFKPSSGPSSCDTWSDNSEPPVQAL
ncbi:hypothetical protein OPT61_g2705 [Boeremia exigua]|uniref:Uncharacterized protein n=1 Tax=Boeremia exigua TaxID=749465 RepID=A0ACC2IKK0_9PLEO|nr:hypothetical protein OPT61_g2705 [Boeremia exigua]